MASTVAPSGLTITRNNFKFTATWKIADADYGKGQQCQWRIYTGKWSNWTSINVSASATTATASLSASSYWPNRSTYLYRIQFRVRGQRNPVTKSGKTTTYDWSGWREKTMELSAPERPSLKMTQSDEYANVCTFSWSTPNVSASSLRPVADVEWQTRLIRESTITDGAKLTWKSSCIGWATGTGSASGSSTRTEDTDLLAAAGYTRWFRVRSRGCGGNGSVKGCSAWRYAKRVYAKPYKPTINSAKKEGSMAQPWIRMKWNANQNAAHPIDNVEAQYTIGTPGSNMTVPVGADWTTAATISDTSGTDTAFFLADSALDVDECLWVRAVANHEWYENPSAAKLTIAGKLATPTGLSVQTDGSTYRATVTADNESDVPDSQLAIVFREKGKKDIIVGVIAHGSTSATVQCPKWSAAGNITFGVYAFQGTATYKTGSNGSRSYTIKANMQSATTFAGGTVPVAPSGVEVSRSETPGEAILEWGWAWSSANLAEISWSQNPNAWESTDEPETYTITNLNTPRWRISGLEEGVTWYFRVRLAQESDGETTYGPYSDAVELDMSSAPSIPSLVLSKPVITDGEIFTASWTYSTTDGTFQSYAEIYEATVSGDTVTPTTRLASTETAQHVEITPPDTWEEGTTYYLIARVTSTSGKVSEWSDPYPITVAEELVLDVDSTSLIEETIGEGDAERTVLSLKGMPLTATILGAGDGGTTTLAIERAADYHMLRPDGSAVDGYEGETIALIRQNGEDAIYVTLEDLIGALDDGAAYNLVVTIEGDYGQMASETIPFEVHWTHQAEIPSATVEIIDGAAKITPIAPEGVGTGDVCDIYRLTVDLPELIVEGGEFGVDYVDPYPAIGPAGGHRVVHRTRNGDYITEDNQPAWIDLGEDDGDSLVIDYGIINFGNDSIDIRYNSKLSSSWDKDFKETKYLGGSIQGDWNPAVSKTGTIEFIVPYDDLDSVQKLRRLAEYSGICHVRTNDGASYSANVSVSDNIGYDEAGKLMHYSLTVTRVEPQTLDGLLYSEWAAV